MKKLFKVAFFFLVVLFVSFVAYNHTSCLSCMNLKQTVVIFMMHFCSIYNMSGCTKLLAHQTWFSPGLAFAIAEIGNQSILLLLKI